MLCADMLITLPRLIVRLIVFYLRKDMEVLAATCWYAIAMLRFTSIVFIFVVLTDQY